MDSLKPLRRFSYAALGVAFTHLVFGGIVRISGSGMGCGDNWPKCYGRWFPPLDQPTLVIEWTHRLLASILVITVLSLALFAWSRRRVPGVGGRGGVLRSALWAVAAVFGAAILGAVTVKLGNAPDATVAHWIVAMTLFALLAATALRAGALGGARALREKTSVKTARSADGAAVLALLAVVMGALTANFPSAAIACRGFPACGRDPSAAAGAVHIQLTHRVIALLLLLHLIGMVITLAKRSEESRVVSRAAQVALGLVVLQLAIAAAMVLGTLPPVLRSLHEAVGVSVWLGSFVLAYLARLSSAIRYRESTAGVVDPVTAEPRAASPESPVPTMAVIVARGADLL